ncbi:hypothetical protein OCK02_22480 [Rhizobium sp. TRM96647]|jgi:hypothetical protein|nr:hypothetical protein [Rhizobium sp. TRM96647]MCV3738946.1 hypothetical protein [Rhizobium sp. TRM96647]MCV3760655.1 hypothetical protein [Rhizobium sp. TRM96650]
MLKREQLIGADFSSQRHPFRGARHLDGICVRRTELWGITPNFDQVEEA